MFTDAIKSLKDGLMQLISGKGGKGGARDVSDTVIRSVTSKFVKSIVGSMIKKFGPIEESSASIVGTVAVIIGMVLRQVTHLTPFYDNFITDTAQEVSDVLCDLAGKGKDTPEKIAERKKLMASIARLLINAQIRYARDIDVEDFFVEFNDLMAQMDEKGQAAFVEMISKFNQKQLADFMRMTTETKHAFFGNFFKKEVKPTDKKGLREWLRDIKKTTTSVLETIGEGLKKFDDQFKPNTPAVELGGQLKGWLDNLGK